MSSHSKVLKIAKFFLCRRRKKSESSERFLLQSERYIYGDPYVQAEVRCVKSSWSSFVFQRFGFLLYSSLSTSEEFWYRFSMHGYEIYRTDTTGWEICCRKMILSNGFALSCPFDFIERFNGILVNLWNVEYLKNIWLTQIRSTGSFPDSISLILWYLYGISHNHA